MPDILSQGGDRESGPWPRRMAVAVVLALVAAAIAYYLPRSRPDTAPPARPTATAVPGPVSQGFSGDQGVAAEPDGITGLTSPWPGDLRLPATGPQPVWFYPATGQTAPIGGLPRQQAGYQFVRAAGGWAVQASPDVRVACASCAGPPRTVYFLADSGQSVTRVGLANAVAPAAAGTLWLTSYPPGADPRTAAGVAREVSRAGRSSGSQVTLPASYLIERGTGRGLLLAPVVRGPATMADELWDPAAAQPGRTFARVIAASATHVAWLPPCVTRCRLQVLNLATGRPETVGLPAASSAVNAAFSPDGSLLAVELSFSNNSADGAQPVQLEVVSLATGRLTAVPQTWVSSTALVGFGWAAGRDRLVAELSFTTTVQLASWRPGASRLAIAAVRSQHSPASLVIGPYAR